MSDLSATEDRTSPAGSTAGVSSADQRQRDGVAWDIIQEALNTYDSFMLDDDYNGLGTLNQIMKRMRERVSLYRSPATVSQDQQSTNADETKE